MLERGVFVIWGETAQPPTRKDTEQMSKIPNAILRISALVGVCPEIEELDVNPLAVLPGGVSALDVRIRVARSA